MTTGRRDVEEEEVEEEELQKKPGGQHLIGEKSLISPEGKRRFRDEDHDEDRDDE